MQVTVEISLYPLQSDYEESIINFIKALKTYNGIEVYTNAMSTQLTGEWSAVMKAIDIELGKVFHLLDTCSTVIKIVNKKLAIEQGHLDFD